MKKFIIWPAIVPALVFCHDEPTSTKLPYDRGTELNVPGTTEGGTPLHHPPSRDDTADSFLSAPIVQYTEADGTRVEYDEDCTDPDSDPYDQYEYDPAEVDDEANDESDEKMGDE